MAIVSETLIHSYNMKNKILDLLKGDGLTFTEIKIELNLTKGELSNYMMSLKRNSLVEYQPSDIGKYKNLKRYKTCQDAKNYDEAMDIIRKRACGIKPKIGPRDPKFDPRASMKVSADKYHTSGNKNKVAAWQGYTTFGDL